MQGQAQSRNGDLDSYCPEPLRQSVAQLAPLLYQDLKRAAHSQRVKLFSPNTLTTTALINEAFVRLHDQPGFGSHAEFLRIAAITMRHLLIDRVRSQLAAKRGGGMQQVDLDDAAELVVDQEDAVLAVHEALHAMADFAPRMAQVVECRYFAGYTEAETAEALGVTERTVRRDWVSAKAWLAAELGPQVLGSEAESATP